MKGIAGDVLTVLLIVPYGLSLWLEVRRERREKRRLEGIMEEFRADMKRIREEQEDDAA